MASLKTQWHQLKTDLAAFKRTLALLRALPRFFRERVTVPQAEEEIKRLLDSRVERFLQMVRSEVYEQPASPYLRLLKHAGCEFSDFRGQVYRDGLEKTLANLSVEGVYFTSDEFKGKKEVIRRGTSFRVSPKDFERRNSSVGFVMESSGSRNQPLKTLSALDWHAVRAMGEAIFYAANNLFLLTHANYEPLLAGYTHFVLVNGKLGVPVDRWFALEVGAHGALENRYHYMNARVIAQFGDSFGHGIARPEYASPSDLKSIMDWIAENQRTGKKCCLTTVVSRGVRIARKATELGLSLEGTTFALSGEPLTHTKKRLIEDTGACIALRCGPGGGMGASLGCGDAQFIDEMHVPLHMFTLVENPRIIDYADAGIHPLMLTTLHPAAPRFLLNVENGDHATVFKRNCRCPLEKVGFTQRIHTVRSFEKMTSEGVNYPGSDLLELVENTFPSEFGGGPGDYQLVEEEDEKSQTRLILAVHPEVGVVDEAKLLMRLQQGLAQGSRNHRFISKIWQDAGTFGIRREAPYASARGKILPLHIKRKY